MDLKCAHSIELLPSDIQGKLRSAPVFYSKEYAQYVSSRGRVPLYLYCSDYCALFEHSQILAFRFVSSPVEYIALTQSPRATPEAFLDSCLATLKESFHVHWINPPSSAALFHSCPSNSVRIPFGSYIIDLSPPEETLWANLHGKHRNSIRRAEKGGVTIRMGGIELLDDYLRLDHETWERSARQSPGRRFFLPLLAAMPNLCSLFVAYRNGIAQGGAVFLHSAAMSYYMYGASAHEPEPGAMNLLHWTAIRHMRAHGVARYSFVGCRINEDAGSKYEGLQRFKSRFGGTLVQGYLFKAILNHRMHALFRMLLRIRHPHHPWAHDVIDQELHKWPELNRQGR